MEHVLLEKWIKQFTSGDNAPMAQIMKDHGSYCTGNLQRLFNCQYADAEDIFMDALIVFRKNMIQEKIEVMDNLRGYIFSICRNLFLKKYNEKKTKNEKQDDLMFYFYLNRYSKEEYDLMIVKEKDKENQAEKEERISHIYTTLNELDKKCQKILKLFYVDNKSMEEIAKVLNFKNRNVAKTSKSRCYKSWRAKIETLIHK